MSCLKAPPSASVSVGGSPSGAYLQLFDSDDNVSIVHVW